MWYGCGWVECDDCVLWLYVQKHDFALGRVLAQALAVHPHASGLWVLAAKTQMEQDRDIAAARCVTWLPNVFPRLTVTSSVGLCCSEGSGETPSHITSGTRHFVLNSFMWTRFSAVRRSWGWKERRCVCVSVCTCKLALGSPRVLSCGRKPLQRLMSFCCTEQHLQCTMKQS